jgi:hypothetical protein
VGLRAGERTLSQEGECKRAKTPDVHAVEANQEHINPFSPGIGVTIANISKLCLQGQRGKCLQKLPAEKVLNIRMMVSRFKSDDSNTSIRGITVDDCCSHEC